MNKLIENLFTQALDEAVPETWTTLGPVQLMRLRDKFAELIVKECIRLNKAQLVVIPEKQEDWDGHNYGMTAAVYGFEDLIKEHFGVEE